MYCDLPVFARCCFCMPLRKGILTFGYINIIYCAFMVGYYSYSVHHDMDFAFFYHWSGSSLPSELCVAIFCLEVMFGAVLIYGTHKKSPFCLKAYLYFTITTTILVIALQLLRFIRYQRPGLFIEVAIFCATGLCIQVYLIVLVRSLLRKIQTDMQHLFDNPLHQIVSGEVKIESNGIYNNNTVEPIEL